MLAVVVASVALYLPATRLRCAPVRLQLQQPNDDLKIGFSRGDDDGPKTSFAPDKRPETAPKKTVNEELMEEIQALMPPEKPAPKEAKPVDLNGIKPRDLLFGLPVGSVALLVPRVAMASEGRLPSGLLAVQRTQDAGRRAAHAPNGRPHDSRPDPAALTPRIGATTYFVVCYAAIQFMLGSAEYFNAHPIAETDFYFVQRLSSLARVVVVGMAALGSGVTGGAAGMTRRPAPRWWPCAALACLPGFPAAPACWLAGAAAA